MIILLLFLCCFWTSEAENFLDNTKTCKDEYTKLSLTLNDKQKAKIKDTFPWEIYESTHGDITGEFETDFFLDLIQRSKKRSKAEQITIPWENLLTGDNDQKLKIYIWKFDMPTLVLGYYLCKTEGGKNGEPHIGVAVGTSPGGVATEVSERVEEFLAYVKELKKDLKFTSHTNTQ